MTLKLLVPQLLCILANGLLMQSGEWKSQAVTTKKNSYMVRDVPTVHLEPFYIYDDPHINSEIQFAGCTMKNSSLDYLAVTKDFLGQMKKHQSRVSDPSQAKWYIVPWDIDETYWYVDGCNGKTAKEWMNYALDRLETSTYFKKNEGRDHIWVAMRFNLINPTEWSFIPVNRAHILTHMVVGRYISYHLQTGEDVYGFDALPYHFTKLERSTEDWRCTMLLPAKSAPNLFVEQENFETWNKRPNTIFFRGRKPKRCRIGDPVRNVTMDLQHVIPGSIIEPGHADTPEQYIHEITQAKFCLVMSCDDVQTSRFVDSLAAGCLPVVIADGWDIVAKPFAEHINYDTFTIKIPESLWLADPVGSAHWIYHWPDVKLRRMHAALYEARNALLWNHPESTVAEMAMQQVNDECSELPEGDEMPDDAQWVSNERGSSFG